METILSTMNVSEAISIEESLPPGKYMVTMQTDSPLPPNVLVKMQTELQSNGIVLLSDISQTGTYPNVVGISYSRPGGIAGAEVALAVIPIIVPLAIIGTTVWGILKLQDITSSIMPVLFLIFGSIIILGVVLREPAGKYIGGRL